MFSFVLYDDGYLYNVKHGWVNNELSIDMYNIDTRKYDRQTYNVEFAADVANPRIVNGVLYYFHVAIDIKTKTITRCQNQPCHTGQKNSKYYICRDDNIYYVRKIADNKTICEFANTAVFHVDNIILCGDHVAVSSASSLPPYVDYMDKYKPIAFVFGYDIIALF
jgi:hypothetical protein